MYSIEESRTGIICEQREPLEARESQVMAVTDFVEMANAPLVEKGSKHGLIVGDHALADQPPMPLASLDTKGSQLIKLHSSAGIDYTRCSAFLASR